MTKSLLKFWSDPSQIIYQIYKGPPHDFLYFLNFLFFNLHDLFGLFDLIFIVNVAKYFQVQVKHIMSKIWMCQSSYSPTLIESLSPWNVHLRFIEECNTSRRG